MLILEQVSPGVFDLAFDASAEADALVATVVYAVLFTDAEAPESRVAEQWERSGWWADPSRGTGLWYVRRQGLSAAARREALDMIRNGLIQHDRAFASVTVSDATAAGNVSSVIAEISGTHNGHQFALSVNL